MPHCRTLARSVIVASALILATPLAATAAPAHHPAGAPVTVWTTSNLLADDNNQVIGLDPATGKETTRLSEGKEAEPWSMAVSKDQHTAYFANHHSGTLSVVDLTGHTPVKEIPVNADGDYLRLSADGRTAYVTGMHSESLVVVDLVAGKAAKTIELGTPAEGLALSPDGKSAYVGLYAKNEVARIDLATGKTTASFSGAKAPRRVEISADGKQLYTSDYYGGTVSRFDTAHPSAAPSQITVGGQPYQTRLSADGTLLYVANTGGGISEISTASFTEVRKIAVADAFGELALTPDGKQLFHAQEDKGGIERIDPGTGKVLGTVGADVSGPMGLAVTTG